MISKKELLISELRSELRDLRSEENLADYEHVKWTLPESEWEELKERIKERIEVITILLKK